MDGLECWDVNTSMHPPAILFFLIPLVLGLWLLVRGLRPKRRGDTPYCAACGYNLTGLAGELCPECGEDYRQTGGTVYGTRRSRPLSTIGGAMCLAICGVMLTVPLQSIN